MPSQTFNDILQFFGWIAIFAGGFKAIQYFFGISPTGKLTIRMEKAEEKLDNDFARLEKMDERIADIEKKLDDTKAETKQINDALLMLGKSQIQMLRHMANGNGKEELMKEADRLTDFFIDNR